MSPGEFAAIAGPAISVMLSGLAAFVALPFLVLLGGRFGADIAAPMTQIVEFVSDLAERLAQVLLALLALLVGAVVLLRYGFGFSSNLLADSTLYAHVFTFVLASAAALGRDGHVRVDVFYAGLSPRRKAAVNLFGYIAFAAPMLLVILAYSTPYVAQTWRIGERSVEADGLPLLFLLKTSIPVFALLLLAQAIAEACRNAAVLRGVAPAPKRFAPDEVAPG